MWSVLRHGLQEEKAPGEGQAAARQQAHPGGRGEASRVGPDPGEGGQQGDPPEEHQAAGRGPAAGMGGARGGGLRDVRQVDERRLLVAGSTNVMCVCVYFFKFSYLQFLNCQIFY